MYNWNSFGEPAVIYIFSILILILLIFLGVKEYQKTDSTIRNYFIPGLIFKMMCSIGVGLLYTQYYPSGDTFGFFEDGHQIGQLAISEPVRFFKFLWNGNTDFEIWNQLNFQQPRALFFSKLTAVAYLIGFGNYWVIGLLFSVLSFSTTWKLVKQIVGYFPTTKLAAVVGFLFFPSVVFWSSGLLKESVAIAGLYLVVSVFLKFWVRAKINFLDGLLLIVGFWLLWNLKYYYAGVLVISMVAMLIGQIILKQRPSIRPYSLTLLFLLLLVVPFLVVTQLHPNFYTSRILEVVVKNYDAYQAISKPENLIRYYQLEATPLSIFINTPWALFSGLFRPFVWEAQTFFQFVAGAETLIILILFVNAMRHLKKRISNADLLLVLGVITYVTLLAIFLSISTPNMGTLVRYRIGFYPFFIYLLLIKNPWIALRNRLLVK